MSQFPHARRATDRADERRVERNIDRDNDRFDAPADDLSHSLAHDIALTMTRTAQTAQTARALWRNRGLDSGTGAHLPSDGEHGRIERIPDGIVVIDVMEAMEAIDAIERSQADARSHVGTGFAESAPPVESLPQSQQSLQFEQFEQSEFSEQSEHSVQLPDSRPEPLSPALLSSTRWASPARRDMTTSGPDSDEFRTVQTTPSGAPAMPPPLGHAPAPGPDEAERLAALRRYEILDTPPEPAFDRIVRLATHVLGAPISLVSLIDESRQWFKARQGIDATHTPRSMAFCAHAILDDEVLVVPDARADRRFADNPLVTGEPNIRFYAGAPLRTPEGHRLGTLCVIDRRPRELDEEKRSLLADLSALVVDELELRRVNRVLGDMAMRDPLTGTLNRRAFLMQADRLFAAARAQQRRLSVLMLDIDHFKAVNDTWGHTIGDRVIVELTLVLRATLRKGTVVGRLGGEEFAVLLPEADAQRARQAAERVLIAIGGASVPGPNGHAGSPVRFSASIGVGSLSSDDVDFGTLLQRADRALYAAKQGGRNRVAAL